MWVKLFWVKFRATLPTCSYFTQLGASIFQPKVCQILTQFLFKWDFLFVSKLCCYIIFYPLMVNWVYSFNWKYFVLKYVQVHSFYIWKKEFRNICFFCQDFAIIFVHWNTTICTQFLIFDFLNPLFFTINQMLWPNSTLVAFLPDTIQLLQYFMDDYSISIRVKMLK